MQKSNKKRNYLIIMILGILFIITGCLKNSKEEEKILKNEEIILKQVLKDVKLYSNEEKREIKDAIIGEGIYINVLTTDKLTGYEGWYYYSSEDLSKLSVNKTEELLFLLAICGPKGRVYCVFGDKGIGIYDYKSIEETKANGEELKIDLEEKVKKIDNTGIIELKVIETGTGNNKKAYLIDYPIVTKGGIIIKY